MYIYEVAKSLEFCFGHEKLNQNKKILLRAVAQWELHSHSPTTLSPTVTTHFRNDNIFSFNSNRIRH